MMAAGGDQQQYRDKPAAEIGWEEQHRQKKRESIDKKKREKKGGGGGSGGVSKYGPVLTLLDGLFSTTIVGPAVVGYWRGTWALSGFYIHPEDHRLSCLSAVILGFCGLFGFNVGQQLFERWLQPDKHRLLFYCGSRLYTYVFGFCCVNAWRGAWQALDLYTEHSLLAVASTTGLSMLGLGLMRTLRNIAAPPFAISLDNFAGYFEVPTLFRVNNRSTRDWPLYILDCAFSVGVVGTLVVFVWRGAWALLDLYLFPESRENSSMGSLIMGYVLVLLAFSVQPLVRYGCARLQGLRRLLLADLFLLLSFLGTVNVWRGIWNALDIYLLPSMPHTSCWITHMGCFLLLVLLNCSNSILVRGVYIDGEEQGGRCVDLPCHYLRLFFEEQRQRKEARRTTKLIVAEPCGDGHKEPSAVENGALLSTNPESLV